MDTIVKMNQNDWASIPKIIILMVMRECWHEKMFQTVVAPIIIRPYM